jgi:hypothetical protein
VGAGDAPPARRQQCIEQARALNPRPGGVYPIAGPNLVGRKLEGRTLSGLAIIGVNLCLVGFFAAAWPVLKGPQVIVGGVLFAALAER